MKGKDRPVNAQCRELENIVQDDENPLADMDRPSFDFFEVEKLN